ncbi:MAG: aldo/keto reductase [Treponema sp.]|uniref:aldo/keto reductase n=1 Tax=Treponema sp. TaxID=166 RepID=UPI00298E613A|nr:aldo/keto reductase [Treponema sp.]MCQ2601799.1 aldo/keto reductase [Treponema sp.]
MKTITLGSTGITTPQNAFGALPIQRDDFETASKILRRAYEGGMTFFDTARAYSDSEEKMGLALSDVRSKIHIATKTMGKTPDEVKAQIETSLKNLKTDYVDIYQFHCVDQCYRPGDGTGMYEVMEDLKRQGMIRHIGITAHKIGVAEEAVKSRLYETMQFPFSYLSGQREIDLINLCKEHNVGFIAMKGLAGGLITNSKAAYTYMTQFDNVVPIWGIQHMSELEQWLSFMENSPAYDDQMKAFVEQDKKSFGDDFCRGCGYCMPCPQGIIINNCARMSQLIRRSPSATWLSDYWQDAFKKIPNCTGCGACKKKCPYGLDIPNLLKKNYDDYQNILSGKTKV